MKQRIWLIIGIVLIVLAALFTLSIRKKINPQSSPLKQNKTVLASDLFNQAKELEAKAKLLEAKAAYQRLINEFSNSNQVLNWQREIESLNMKLLFSPILTPKSTLYVIKPGDTLNKIAGEFNTTAELIMKSNQIISDKIFPGQKIKVWVAPFTLIIDKSQNTLILKTDEEVIKTYIVSTGTNNSTPTGTYKIINKLQNPTWFKAGAVVPADSPENILGSRWLGFNLSGYGIHGTTEPQNLGKQVTQGCIRMSNADAEELYTIIPVGIEATIVD